VLFSAGGWASTVAVTSGTLDCVYIAGQTAPGGGVGYYRKYNILTLDDDSEDVVVRGLTINGEAVDDGATIYNTPQFRVINAERVVIAENNFLWAVEASLNIGGTTSTDTVKNITLQRNFFGQAQAMEPTATELNPTAGEYRHVSVYKNAWVSSGWRNPLIGTDDAGVAIPDTVPRVKMVGNLWYNWAQGTAMVLGQMADVIDSYCRPGPMTPAGTAGGDSNDYSWCVSLYARTSEHRDSASSLYVERILGSKNQSNETSAATLWTDGNPAQEVGCYYRDCNDPAGGGDARDSVGTGIKRDTEITAADIPMPRVQPATLPDELLGVTVSDSGQVGAYRYITCAGQWAFRSDSAVAALLKEARDSTGVSSYTTIDSSYVAARQTYTKAAGTACTDKDSDGLPDDYEARYYPADSVSLPPDSVAPNYAPHVAVEMYVNGLDFNAGESGGVDPAPPTYNQNNVTVELVLIDDSIKRVFRDTAGTVTDSMWVRGFDEDSIDANARFRAYISSVRDSGIAFTCDSALVSGTVQDSAAVDSVFSDWGIEGSDPWSVSVPGCN
jgi:hypothetical protein